MASERRKMKIVIFFIEKKVELFHHFGRIGTFEAEEVFFHELASGKITSEASKVPMSPKMMKNETFSL